MKLVHSDEATVYYKIEGPTGKGSLTEAIQFHRDLIVSTTGTPQEPIERLPVGVKSIAEEIFDLKEWKLKLVLVTSQETKQKQVAEPCIDYINLELTGGLQPRFGATERLASLWLRYHNGKLITFEELRSEVARIFGIYGCHYELFVDGCKLDESSNLAAISGSLVYVVKVGKQPPCGKEPPIGRTVCRFINILGSESKKASILLENPKENFFLTNDTLRARLGSIFPNTNVLLPPVSPLAFDGFSIRCVEKDKDPSHH